MKSNCDRRLRTAAKAYRDILQLVFSVIGLLQKVLHISLRWKIPGLIFGQAVLCQGIVVGSGLLWAIVRRSRAALLFQHAFSSSLYEGEPKALWAFPLPETKFHRLFNNRSAPLQ